MLPQVAKAVHEGAGDPQGSSVTDFKRRRMAILKLRNYLNPDSLVVIESTEIAAIDMYLEGSIVTLKSGSTVPVHDSTEELYNLLIH